MIRCPICDEPPDRGHCLLEWNVSVGERRLGDPWPLVDRLNHAVASLLAECAAADSFPNDAALRDTFASCAALRDAGCSEYDISDEIDDEIEGFVVRKLRTAPGGVVETNSRDVVGGPHEEECVTIWARDPDVVCAHLLDTLASIEVERDRIHSGGGEASPGGSP